ncbi:MAG TPA: hypothetical protein VFA66_14525 [Gaiellaceae bacterium]|nr:hypothetical protein [Gaiellaceae bacterium]
MQRAKPTAAQIKAVRAVLYKRARLQRIVADLRSIDVLMNFDNPSVAGVAPSWFLEATGDLTTGVKEAANRCKRIGSAYREMSRELAAVRIPAADRADLRLALTEQAIVWERRGAIWAEDSAPDATAAAAELKSHLMSAVRAAARVAPYLRQGNQLADLLR